MKPGLQVSRRLAIVAGVVLPLAETLRRWSQLGQPSIWPFWLDDFAIGGFLLYGAWNTSSCAWFFSFLPSVGSQ